MWLSRDKKEKTAAASKTVANKLDAEKQPRKISGFWAYILGGILIFIIVMPVMDRMVEHNDEGASLLATGLALAGIYFGGYFSQLITIRRKLIPTQWFFIMAIIVVVLVSWIFIIGQNPLRNKPTLNMLFFGLPFVLCSVIIGAMTKMIKSTLDYTLQEARLDAAQSQTELSLLQSQLSPHFLFNTLNNLYGISITEHTKVPTLLLKLSDLLRYSLYEARDTFVPMSKEVEYLNNYIEFERIRMGERLNLRTAIENFTDDNMKIAPMLLIVFVENAFKHSKNTMNERVFIEMEIKTWGSFLLFTMKNSMPGPAAEQDQELMAEASQKTGGLGLVNVKKRLKLLYPNLHDLQINQGEKEFVVMLQLKIK